MGNGSIKTPRPEEKTCLASNHKDPPGLQSDILRMRLEYLELELAQRDHVLEAQELHLQHLQRELDAKVSQIDKLQDAIGYNNSLGCGPPELCHRCFSVINQCPSRFHKVAVEVHQRLKAKEGVSAEPTSENFCGGLRPIHISIVKPIRKDSEIKKLMNDAITNNDFLKRLEPQHMREMVDCMYEKVYTKGQLVIQEGESGNYLYVLAAVVKSHIWALDRQTFQAIMMRTAQAQHEEYFSFLRSVSLLQELPEEKLAKIVDCLEVDYFQKGEYIIREGEDGNTFFIIAKGEVIVTQSTEGFAEPQQIKTLGVGDYFGEKALISEELRSANIVCNENDTHCLVVDRDNFNQMVGTYEELQAYLKEYVEELCRNDERRNALPHSPLMESTEVQELRRLKERIVLLPHNQPFQQLEVVATLGVGGFGRVELVKLKDEDTTFALKCIKKKHVVDTRQQEHIYSEKSILHQTNSAFIIRLFRTFRDTKYVYMLLEVCLGGELWTVLRDMNYFDEPTARFCIGCVLEAFDYLHKMGIIYRDLKPENLLLDAKGYVKMADFGFAKKIGLGKKTWTFCGTPEYVAPEVIMNKGHDFGADCWSLGILIFELLTGNPPFGGSDPIKIYTMVLYGIEKVDFPKRIGRRPDDLIRRLCKQNPVERVGNKKNGIIDIKKHKWFQGFNWEGLRGHKLLSPLKRELNGPMDHSHFDIFPPDMEITPDESSGWDKDF
ncbi:cGMP-dependent protein kinase 2 isoform X4 [Syngnathoides biaculeatus]|uniref:cGMP-dependent protein kinase 2 isoform X4 n=1 Tax=Syngnathoides biaculeatus TaxID=300417 RepID=UPI002ADD9478|nr:cGMP-dependent protein kinase 2 isoform X4 [Syngnathoides biaculeatus]